MPLPLHQVRESGELPRQLPSGPAVPGGDAGVRVGVAGEGLAVEYHGQQALLCGASPLAMDLWASTRLLVFRHHGSCALQPRHSFRLQKQEDGCRRRSVEIFILRPGNLIRSQY